MVLLAANKKKACNHKEHRLLNDNVKEMLN